MKGKFEVARVAAIHTAVIRERVPRDQLSKFVPAACGEVWSFVKSKGLTGAGRHVALYLEDDVVEVGVEVPERFTGNDRVRSSTLPAGEVLTTVHLGPYPELRDVHTAMRRWCIDNGYKVPKTCWEIYGHWDPSWNRDASRIRTDVFYLLS